MIASSYFVNDFTLLMLTSSAVRPNYEEIQNKTIGFRLDSQTLAGRAWLCPATRVGQSSNHASLTLAFTKESTWDYGESTRRTSSACSRPCKAKATIFSCILGLMCAAKHHDCTFFFTINMEIRPKANDIMNKETILDPLLKSPETVLRLFPSYTNPSFFLKFQQRFSYIKYKEKMVYITLLMQSTTSQSTIIFQPVNVCTSLEYYSTNKPIYFQSSMVLLSISVLVKKVDCSVEPSFYENKPQSACSNG